MPFTYEVRANGVDGVHTVNCQWLAAIVRVKHRRTYNPFFVGKPKDSSSSEGSEPTGLTSVSLDTAKVDPVAELDTIVLDNCIIQYMTSHGKGEHVSTLQLTLANIGSNFARELCAGDWVLFWAFDNTGDLERVKKLVLDGKSAANDFLSGLKFMGRINSPRRVRFAKPDGTFSVVYRVSAAGFQEFNSIIYYNEMLAAKYQNETLQWMIDFGGEANNFILNASNAGSITAQDAIPKLLRICLGLGPGEESKGMNPYVVQGNQDLEQANKDLQASPNQAYYIPRTVARLLGVSGSDAVKPAGLTYADLIQLYCGVEEYQAPAVSATRDTQGKSQYLGFIPSKKNKLEGEFLPSIIAFNQRSVWSILSTYLNDPINEMFTCMKVNKNGKIMPSFVCRQIPLSSNLYWSENQISTPFTSLPRWRISSGIVSNDDLGPSDAMRVNYIHLPGQDVTGGNVSFNQVLNYVWNPPAVNEADIQRNGLHMYTKQLSAKIIETQYSADTSPGRKWTKLMSDVLMDGHLRWSGTVNCQFIQEPIAPGDNVALDGGIYHIERVNHSGMRTPSGGTTSTTALQLTYGISDETDLNPEGYNIFLTDDDDVTSHEDLGPGVALDV